MAEDNNKMEQLYIQRYDGLQFDEIPAKIDCIKDKEEQDKMRVSDGTLWEVLTAL